MKFTVPPGSKKRLGIMAFCGSLALNIGGILFFVIAWHSFKQPTVIIKSSDSSLQLLSPSFNQSAEPIGQNRHEILHYDTLKQQIEQTLSDAKIGEHDLGLFLQDTTSGSLLGINEREEFIPASLLKIPIMMATLKRVDRGEIQLTDSIELVADDLSDEAGTLYKKGAGAQLTVWELIKDMILASDNTAKNALVRQLSNEELNAVFAHVGIPNPFQADTYNAVTPRGYSRLFKSLYLSTFLSPAVSEKALDIMTDTIAENLIAAGVPPEVQVAHKFGQLPNLLEDCGIIYYPQNPYYLCIMTKNIEETKAADLMKKLSKLTFDYVTAKSS